MANTVAKAKEYKVQDGDTMQSIADANGLTLQELAKFNFGSDKPDDVNKGMRSKVGAFKKSSDGKNLIFSAKDDPGILYIPEKFPEPSFASNGTHNITVKQIPVKTFIPSKVMVEFRPKLNWTGEYGFDWLRIGDNGETSYKTILAGAYKSTTNNPDGTKTVNSYTAAESWEQLKKEYRKIPTEVKEQSNYYVPYLNLYPPDAKGSNPAPPTSAELRIFTIVEDEEPLTLEFDYHKGIFSLDKDILSDKAIDKKREASDKTVKITCLADFDTDQEIKVLAYPKTWKFNDPIPLAGKIIIRANNKGNRKNLKVLLINVKTQVTNAPRIGKIEGSEKTRLKNSLYQAYVHAALENGTDLDLTADPDYKITTLANGSKVYGKFIYKRKNAADTNNDGALNEDAAGSSFFIDLRKKYLDPVKFPERAKYQNYFTVFCLDEPTYDPVTHGQVQTLGVKNVALFQKPGGTRFTGVLAHEVSHGLGLYHTQNSVDNADCKFVFTNKTTYNVMSYNFQKMYYLWKWQWSIIRRNV